MTAWLLSYMGRVKYSFFSKKGYSKDQYIKPSKKLKATKQG